MFSRWGDAKNWRRALNTVIGTADLFPRRVLYSSHARHEKADGIKCNGEGTKKSANLSGRGPPMRVCLAPAPQSEPGRGEVSRGRKGAERTEPASAPASPGRLAPERRPMPAVMIRWFECFTTTPLFPWKCRKVCLWRVFRRLSALTCIAIGGEASTLSVHCAPP